MEVADDGVVGVGQDGGARVGVDRDDVLGAGAAGDVLDGAADAAGQVELRGDLGAGLADLLLVRAPALRGDHAGHPDHAAEQFGQLLERGEAVRAAHAGETLLGVVEHAHLQRVDGRLPYPYADDEPRKAARDAYVSWQGSRYSVPWRFAGKPVWVQQQGAEIEVRYGAERIAVHTVSERRHQVITRREHHEDIPLGAAGGGGKTLIHIQQSAPVVERRSLEAYESIAAGGVQ